MARCGTAIVWPKTRVHRCISSFWSRTVQHQNQFPFCCQKWSVGWVPPLSGAEKKEAGRLGLGGFRAFRGVWAKKLGFVGVGLRYSSVMPKRLLSCVSLCFEEVSFV